MAQGFAWGADLVSSGLTNRFRTGTLSSATDANAQHPSDSVLSVAAPSGRYQLSWDVMDGLTVADDGPIVVRARIRATTNEVNGLGLWTFGSGSSGSEGGLYHNPWRYLNVQRTRLLHYLSGSVTTNIDEVLSSTVLFTSWFEVEAKIAAGTTGWDVDQSFMLDGLSEQTDSANVSSVAGTLHGLGSVSAATYYVDWISYGTDGDPAPTGPVDTRPYDWLTRNTTPFELYGMPEPGVVVPVPTGLNFTNVTQTSMRLNWS